MLKQSKINVTSHRCGALNRDIKCKTLQAAKFLLFLDNEGFLLFFKDRSFHNNTNLHKVFLLTILYNSQTFFSTTV